MDNKFMLDDLKDVIKEVHELLDGAGVEQAKGVACDDPSCNSQLGHRIRTLISERDDLQQQVNGRMRAR